MSDARTTSVTDCVVLPLRTGGGGPAQTISVQHHRNCPFPISRVYYLFDVPAGAMRGGHAHRELHQLVIAARGSFDVFLDDGRNSRSVTLDTDDRALHLVPGIWRELLNFSADSICLVIASAVFDEDDYFREHADFVAFKDASHG